MEQIKKFMSLLDEMGVGYMPIPTLYGHTIVITGQGVDVDFEFDSDGKFKRVIQ